MAICDSGCTYLTPCAYGNACGVTTKSGGIIRIGFIACDYEFTDISDPAEWTTALANGDAVWSGLLVGGKNKATFTKKPMSSCSPEVLSGAEKTITFQDYNTEDTGGTCTEYEFWNTILNNPAAYRLVFITCDSWLYGPIDNFTIEVDEIIEDTNKGNRYIEGTIFWNSKTINT